MRTNPEAPTKEFTSRLTKQGPLRLPGRSVRSIVSAVDDLTGQLVADALDAQKALYGDRRSQTSSSSKHKSKILT